MYKFDFLITAHNEGELLGRAYKSMLNSIKRSLKFIKFEYTLSVFLDNPTESTLKTAYQIKKYDKNLHLDYFTCNDVSELRNYFAINSNADFLSFLDGDDFWGESWIPQVCNYLSNERNQYDLVHPEITVFFKDRVNIEILRSVSRLKRKDFYKLIYRNEWSSSFVCNRSIFHALQFKSGSVSSKSIYAYEDWTFFRDSLSLGIRNVVVPKTVHFHETRKNSNTEWSVNQEKLPHPYTLPTD